jgi:hypothetical protein
MGGAAERDEAERALADQLGGGRVEGLDALAERDLRELAELVRVAKRRQSVALTEAQERAFHHVPRLLRGPVRRVLGG